MVTTTIIELQSGKFKVAFLRPEDIKKKAKAVFSDSTSLFDIERRHNVLQKQYILEKLNKWLHQRKHARKDMITTINNLEYGLDQFKFRQLENLCGYVKIKRQDFENLAPGSDKSRCMKYYQGMIVPILNYCTSYEPKED